MSTEAIIKTKLEAGLSIEHLTIENERHLQPGPATDSPSKVPAVPAHFSRTRLVQRHQLIYGLLADEMKHPIHALSMHLFTQQEWQAKGETVMPSPKCLGGSKGEY